MLNLPPQSEQFQQFAQRSFSSFLHRFNLPQFDMRNNAFDFLRLIMVVMVIFAHCINARYEDNQYPKSIVFINIWDVVNGLFIGTLAVYGFFIISGFLITASWFNSKSPWEYITKRVKRIYPGFLVSLFVAAFLFVPIIYFIGNKNVLREALVNFPILLRLCLEYFFRNMWVEIYTPDIKYLPLLNNYGYSVNGSLWSLIHEARAYFVVLLLGLFKVFDRKYLILIAFFVLNLLYIGGVYNSEIRLSLSIFFTNFAFIALFTYFFAGVSFYLFRDTIKYNWLLFTIAVICISFSISTNNFAIFAPVCLTYIILFLSQVLPFKNLSKKWGDCTYGAYLYSQMIQVILVQTPVRDMGWWWFFAFSMLLSIPAGYLSYHLVEKRFLIRKSTISTTAIKQ